MLLNQCLSHFLPQNLSQLAFLLDEVEWKEVGRHQEFLINTVIHHQNLLGFVRQVRVDFSVKIQ